LVRHQHIWYCVAGNCDKLAALAQIEQKGAKWLLTAAGKKILSAQSNKRNMGFGFEGGDGQRL
jgi:hypothetical protein